MTSSPRSEGRDRPILFSGPMVRALLDGSKTQTRRVVKLGLLGDRRGSKIRDPKDGYGFLIERWEKTGRSFTDFGRAERISCPYGQPGDRLWVRETWRSWATVGAGTEVRTEYAADGATIDRHLDEWSVPQSVRDGKWGPSIFMPRWASRLTLEITRVRVERVNCITEADAMAEGAEPILVPPDGGSAPHVEGFRELWDSLNKSRGYAFDSGSWVWAIDFTRISA